MIRHVALFRFKNSIPEPDLDAVLQRFHGLKGKVAGLQSVHVGANCSPETLDKGFLRGIILDFDSIESLQGYLSHPAHVAIAEDVIASLANSLDEDVIVFDLQTGE
ncbi:MAG: Dabb family protein [Rhodobacteraceae bacterium]|nr:Dabb family protein [Paracoccaceae bacterium]